MLFDRICRENGVEHLLTQHRKPTTTGKIERFHRTMRIEFDTTRVFTTLKTAQGALDEWVSYYNTLRTHQSLSDATPASRFQSVDAPSRVPAPLPDRSGERSPARSHATGSSALAGSRSASARTTAAGACNVLVTDALLQFWVGNELLKTVARTSTGDIRKKRAAGTARRR